MNFVRFVAALILVLSMLNLPVLAVQNNAEKDSSITLEEALKDNRLAWDMHPDGSYTQRRPKEGQKEKNFHPDQYLHRFLFQDYVRTCSEEKRPPGQRCSKSLVIVTGF